MTDYALYVNDEGTVLVRIWPSGNAEIATRTHPDAIWGPPVALRSEGATVTVSSGVRDA